MDSYLSNIEVELVEHSPGVPFTGIGRYTRELYRHLVSRVPVRLATHVDPPLTKSVSFLHHLPVGVQAHKPGSIVHFIEDLGCSQMLLRPVHPAVATSHDLGMLVWPAEAKMHRPLDRILVMLSYLGLKRMDTIITVSEYCRQAVIRQLRVSPSRVVAILSGNDNRLFRPVAHARAKLEAQYGLADNSDCFNLLYVGSELPRKNLATLFRVLRLLPTNVRLLKVGAAGPERFREHTRRLVAKLGIGERVTFFEQVPEKDMPLFYSAADVYVCASFLEGFGHPIVEAMACGTPVVCSNNSSLPEITAGAALLVPPGDADAFAEAVVTVLCDQAVRDRMAECGIERASRFSWDRTAQAVAAVYERVTSNGSCRY